MKKLLFALVVAAAVAASGTGLSDLKLKAKTDRENPIGYKVGEKIRFDFFLDGVKELPMASKREEADMLLDEILLRMKGE